MCMFMYMLMYMFMYSICVQYVHMGDFGVSISTWSFEGTIGHLWDLLDSKPP